MMLENTPSRSRQSGFAGCIADASLPAPIELALDGKPGLAVGAYLNNTVCALYESNAFISAPNGDLDSRAACETFTETISHLLDVVQLEPAWVACDLHADFYSTRYAHSFAHERKIPLIEVQHHHAHIGAVMAEHRLTGPALGLALDGFGLGSDGGAWGGELLLLNGAECQRRGHLRTLPLPGGDAAAREPWRMAAASLHELGRSDEIPQRFGAPGAMIANMLEKKINCPMSSSAGRLFDAAAGLLGITPALPHEAQAAIMLESLAASFEHIEDMTAMPDGYAIEGTTLNMLPLLARLAERQPPEQNTAQAAALFHVTFAAALTDWVLRNASATGVETIVLGGGCFANRLLSQALGKALAAQGMQVYCATKVPPGDAGLSLGQAWVALQRCPS
jgi:hydrogenase maturation protein HypF